MKKLWADFMFRMASDYKYLHHRIDRQEGSWRWLLRNSVSNNGERYEPRLRNGAKL